MTPPDACARALPSPAARRSTERISPRPSPSGIVAERLRARKRRVSQIRRRVATIAVTLFLASSGGVLVQMATGNDPALAAAAARTAAQAARTTASSSSGTRSSSSGSSSSATTTAVTTSAS